MTASASVGLPEALERAARALREDADQIRPANGDPYQLRQLLDDAAAARVLRWLLEHEPEDGGALADAWSEDPHLDPTPVLHVAEEGLPKAGRKALRRARHRLRSRGVAVEEPRGEPVVAKLARIDDDLEAAVVTPIDPRGSRAVYLVASHPSGGARIFEILLDEARGIGAFEVYSAPRRKVRRFLSEITHAGGRAAVAAEPAAVRALVARAAARQADSRPAPRGFLEWRSRLTEAGDASVTPGERAREALGAADASAVGRAVELVRERALGPWPPEGPALQQAAEKIDELTKSELVVAPAARRAQADAIIDDALEAVFGGDHALHCAERCDEMAYVYWKTDRADDARACLAAADAFRAGAPREQAVARAMLEVLFAPVLQRLEEAPGGAADSPIVKP